MALSDKELSAADLRATQRNWVQYSKQHSKNLPPGSITDFEWKDYCPKAFRCFMVYSSMLLLHNFIFVLINCWYTEMLMFFQTYTRA